MVMMESTITKQCLMTHSKLNFYSNMPNITHSLTQGTTYHKLDI